MICTTLPILPAPLAPFVVDIFSPLLSQLVNYVMTAPSRLAAGFRLRIWDDNCLFEASSHYSGPHGVADDFVTAQLATHHFTPFSTRQLSPLILPEKRTPPSAYGHMASTRKKSEQGCCPSLLANDYKSISSLLSF